MRERRASHRPRRPAEPDRFEALVEQALASIPEPFARALDEVAIVIEDTASPQQLRDARVQPYQTLYGLYEGVARTEYGADWAFVPNKITLFQIPLEDDFPDPAGLEHQVRVTVIHELAHHLGISDRRLHELGAY